MKNVNDGEEIEVGMVANYYGALFIKNEDGKFFWSIEDWDGHEWHEIPERLFKELLKQRCDR